MTDTTEKRASGKRWIKIALAVSLSVNILIVGLAVGTFAQFRKSETPLRAGEATGAYTFALQPKDRRAIGRGMAEFFQSNSDGRKSLRQEYEQMIEVLSADPFDRDAAQAILERQYEFANQRRVAAENLLLDRLESMSASERAEFAERLKEGVKRRSGPPRPNN